MSLNIKRLQKFFRKGTGSTIRVTKVNENGTYTVGNLVNGKVDPTTSRTITTATMKRWYLPL
jgi:hypothetical protein